MDLRDGSGLGSARKSSKLKAKKLDWAPFWPKLEKARNLAPKARWASVFKIPSLEQKNSHKKEIIRIFCTDCHLIYTNLHIGKGWKAQWLIYNLRWEVFYLKMPPMSYFCRKSEARKRNLLRLVEPPFSSTKARISSARKLGAQARPELDNCRPGPSLCLTPFTFVQL